MVKGTAERSPRRRKRTTPITVSDGKQQNLGVAALAAAYQGDLDQANALNEHLAASSVAPMLQGFHCYVAGGIDAYAGRTDRAEEHHERAMALARESGATFVEGIASVGLLTLRATTGRVADALDGYRDLLDYWERTGGWVQQWTTLRNLARLLHSLGDEETATVLDTAADHAPDAPAISDSGDYSHRYGLSADRTTEIRTQAASIDRTRVVEIARHAIARHRGITPAGA